MKNPFRLTGYVSPSYFCDREDETEALISAMENGRNVTLFSQRRMGKTGLIHHTLHHLKKRNMNCFFIDVYATQNAQQFINELGSEILGKADSMPKKIAGKLKEMILSFRPRVTYDQLTGVPSVEFYLQEKAAESTLAQILKYLDDQDSPSAVAIDEFQQVARYPEGNFEATLRTQVQQLKLVNFIFSGSETGLLISMFKDSKRPFYQSTQMLHLQPINEKKYTSFIKRWMKKGSKTISNDALRSIMELTRIHTFYVQMLCNRLFSIPEQEIDTQLVNLTLANILQESEYNYFNYRKMLAPVQWRLLIAVAKEGKLRNPNGQDFLHRHMLGAGSSVRRALAALTDKDMVTHSTDDDGQFYQVSDVFFETWLRTI